jgi:ribosome maturation factor RimP
MGSINEKLYELIRPLCEEENVFLEDVSLHGGGKNRLIKVIVDTESGITLSQCQDLSKKISDTFFRKDMFQGDYRLEVSSPGTNKPLEKPFEYRRSIGKDLTVAYHQQGEVQSVTGQLLDYDGEKITLKQKKDVILISLSDIKEAKIKLKW